MSAQLSAASRLDPAPATRYLHPGELLVSPEPVWVTTILGSCVAVCLWDPALGVGGMNHFLLPERVGEGGAANRFGDGAIAMLVAQVVSAGADPRRLEAKVFGGACVIPTSAPPERHLGARNVERALHELARRALPVREADTGGIRGRRLRFHTGTGEAVLKLL